MDIIAVVCSSRPSLIGGSTSRVLRQAAARVRAFPFVSHQDALDVSLAATQILKSYRYAFVSDPALAEVERTLSAATKGCVRCG